MNYSVVTPTKNEAKYIEETIKSIIIQEEKPQEWFIMDDGSTDATPQIVEKYLKEHPFIRYIKLSGFRPDLVNTGGRVAAIINYADTLRKIPVDIITKLDADTSFEANFFSNILSEFKRDPLLGIASGHLMENGIPEEVKDRNNGRGATLIIRYDCYLKIGKFYESKTRGEDVLAYVAARAKGYKSWTFDYYFNHLKPEGIRKSKLYNQYVTGCYKGSIPYWLPFYLGNVLRDLLKKPFIIGGIVQLFAYIVYRYVLRYKPFPEFVIQQFRKEQKTKFKRFFGIR